MSIMDAERQPLGALTFEAKACLAQGVACLCLNPGACRSVSQGHVEDCL